MRPYGRIFRFFYKNSAETETKKTDHNKKRQKTYLFRSGYKKGRVLCFRSRSAVLFLMVIRYGRSGSRSSYPR